MLARLYVIIIKSYYRLDCLNFSRQTGRLTRRLRSVGLFRPHASNLNYTSIYKHYSRFLVVVSYQQNITTLISFAKLCANFKIDKDNDCQGEHPQR